jgi:hypothetical protein
MRQAVCATCKGQPRADPVIVEPAQREALEPGLARLATRPSLTGLSPTPTGREAPAATARANTAPSSATRTGRQGTQPLCILLIDGMAVAIKGKRRARSTSVTGRHGRRPASQVWTKSRLSRNWPVKLNAINSAMR